MLIICRFDSTPAPAALDQEDEEEERPQPKRPSSTSSFNPTAKKPKIQFKKFDRFERPDIRKSLLNKFLKNRPPGAAGKKAEEGEEAETETETEQSDLGTVSSRYPLINYIDCLLSIYLS